MTSLKNLLPAGWPWRAIVVAALAALVYLLAGPAPEGLVYRQDTLVTGQWWRFLTCHLVHADAGHLAWNLGGVLVPGALFERMTGKWFWPCMGAGVGSIGLWLESWSGLTAYCGLSGLLNTLLAVGLAFEWMRTRSVMVLVVGVGALGKIMVEMGMGTSLFTSVSWAPAPGSHLAGFVAGVSVAFVYWFLCAIDAVKVQFNQSNT